MKAGTTRLGCIRRSPRRAVVSAAGEKDSAPAGRAVGGGRARLGSRRKRGDRRDGTPTSGSAARQRGPQQLPEQQRPSPTESRILDLTKAIESLGELGRNNVSTHKKC